MGRALARAIAAPRPPAPSCPWPGTMLAVPPAAPLQVHHGAGGTASPVRCCRLGPGARGAAAVGSGTRLAGAKSPLPRRRWVRGSWHRGDGVGTGFSRGGQQQPWGLAWLRWRRPGPGYLPAAAFHRGSRPSRGRSLPLASGGGARGWAAARSPHAWGLRGGRPGRPSTAGSAGGGSGQSEGESTTGEFAAAQLEPTLARACQPSL